MGYRKFNPFPVLKTERLTLRQLVGSDVPEIFALRSNVLVNQYLDRSPSQSLEEAGEFIQMINTNIEHSNSIYWAITGNSSDKLIGTICLFNFIEEEGKAEIGFELLPEFQGRGIMLESSTKVIDYGIQHIGLKVIEAYTHINNQGSARLLEKLHFKREGTEDPNLLIFKMTVVP